MIWIRMGIETEAVPMHGWKIGGGGNRTRVRRCFREGVYVRILSSFVRPVKPQQAGDSQD